MMDPGGGPMGNRRQMHNDCELTQHRLQIPQEIWDHIMSQLQGDFPSLKHCSLVCSSWHIASRRYLYLTLSPKNRAQFRQQLPASGLLAVLRRFVVREIHVPREHIHPPYPGATLLTNFASILTEFHFYNVSFDSFPDLARIITALQLLRVLILDGVAWTNTSPWDNLTAQTYPFPTLLKDLRLRNCALNPFSIWLVSQPQLTCLVRLEMDLTTDRDIVSARNCLYHLGPQIIHLDLSFPSRSEAYLLPRIPRECVTSRSAFNLSETLQSIFGVAPCSSLSTLQRLRRVHVRNFIDSAFAYQSTAELMAPMVIASIPVPGIQKLVFYLRLQKAGELDIFSVKWDFFDDALSSEVYSTLELVEFVVAGKANLDGVTSLLALRLPCLARQGILRVRKLS